MLHTSRKRKARRLAMFVAEELARHYRLTLLAEKPTKPGTRRGVTWVPEGRPADLKVRQSGGLGADVALLSHRAHLRVATLGLPWYIECKNREGWNYHTTVAGRRLPGVLREAWEQTYRATSEGRWVPVVVLGKSHLRDPLVFVCAEHCKVLGTHPPVPAGFRCVYLSVRMRAGRTPKLFAILPWSCWLMLHQRWSE